MASLVVVDSETNRVCIFCSQGCDNPPACHLVASGAGVSLEIFFQIPLRLLGGTMLFKPQCMSKDVSFGFPKLRSRHTGTVSETLNDDLGTTHSDLCLWHRIGFPLPPWGPSQFICAIRANQGGSESFSLSKLTDLLSF